MQKPSHVFDTNGCLPAEMQVLWRCWKQSFFLCGSHQKRPHRKFNRCPYHRGDQQNPLAPVCLSYVNSSCRSSSVLQFALSLKILNKEWLSSPLFWYLAAPTAINSINSNLYFISSCVCLTSPSPCGPVLCRWSGFLPGYKPSHYQTSFLDGSPPIQSFLLEISITKWILMGG